MSARGILALPVPSESNQRVPQQPAAEARRKVLLLGPSSFSQDAGQGLVLRDRLLEDLERASGGSLVCSAEGLYFGHRMEARTEEYLERYDPDAVLFYLGSGPFELESIVEVIRTHWPRAYKPALKVARRVKLFAGGGLDGEPGPRGWLYRAPRALVARVTGLNAMVSLEEAIASSIEAVNILARREDLVTLVYFSAVSWPPTFTRAHAMVAEFDKRVREHCRQRRIGYWYRQEEMAKRGFVPDVGKDGMHASPATYAFESEMITELMLRALEGRPCP